MKLSQSSKVNNERYSKSDFAKLKECFCLQIIKGTHHYLKPFSSTLQSSTHFCSNPQASKSELINKKNKLQIVHLQSTLTLKNSFRSVQAKVEIHKKQIKLVSSCLLYINTSAISLKLINNERLEKTMKQVNKAIMIKYNIFYHSFSGWRTQVIKEYAVTSKQLIYCQVPIARQLVYGILMWD